MAAGMDPETLKAITQLVLNVLQPFLATAQAQLAATVQLTDEVRALRVAAEAYVGVHGDAPEPIEAADVPCSHPAASRVSFATSHDDDFHCKACGEMIRRPHAVRS